MLQLHFNAWKPSAYCCRGTECEDKTELGPGGRDAAPGRHFACPCRCVALKLESVSAVHKHAHHAQPPACRYATPGSRPRRQLASAMQPWAPSLP